MDKKTIKFDDIEIEEYKFLQKKSHFDKWYRWKVVSNKLPLGKQHFKYLIDYKDFEENRHVCFLIKKVKVFSKHMKNLEKVRYIIKNKFNSKLIYSKKYLKAEKNKCKGRLSVIMIGSIYRKDGSYYPKYF